MSTSKSSFVSLQRLKQAPADPATVLAQIRRIYFRTTKQSIEHDLAEALDLLKSLPDEETRERATVFMHGLDEMRREWQKAAKTRKTVTKAVPATGATHPPAREARPKGRPSGGRRAKR